MYTFHNHYTTLALVVSLGLFSTEALAKPHHTEDTAYNDTTTTITSTTDTAGAPTLNSVNISGSEVVLSWNTDYATPTGGYDAIIDGVDTNTRYRTTANSVSIDGLDLTKGHCFRVQARYVNSNNVGEVFNSNQICTVQTASVSNGPPTLNSVKISGSEVVLSWSTDHATPEGGYDAIIDGVDTNTRHRTTANSVSIDGMDLSKEHCFRVQARYVDSNNSGEVFNSNQLCSGVQARTVAAGAPTLNSVNVSGSEVVLSWSTDYTTPEGGYDAIIDGVDTNTRYRTTANSVSIDGLDLSKEHCFRVQARYVDSNDSGEVFDSNQLCSNTQSTTVAGAPTLNSVNLSGSEVVLSWSTEYAIPEGGYDAIIDGVDTNTRYRTTANSVSIDGLDLDKDHCFRVQARYVDSSDSGEVFNSNQLCSNAQVAENQAPVISGTAPSTAAVGESYSFTPVANDADGDNLSFSISEQPDWASFDSQTGTLEGIPETADLGSYNDITITVTDGANTSTLTAFSITVETAPEVGSVTLNWDAPLEREDGKTLSPSEIEGYRIYMGDSADTLELVMDVSDNTISQYKLNEIAVGTHYFSVSVYDVEGNESNLSNIVKHTVL
jgi:uncharacterized OB-fold protein